MIALTTVEPEVVVVEKPFPKIMKQARSNNFVLFNSPRHGVCLNGANTGIFFTVLNMDLFVDYNEPVTLQNS